MKKLFCLLLALAMVFCVTGCKDSADTESNASDYEEVIYVYDDETSSQDKTESQASSQPTASNVSSDTGATSSEQTSTEPTSHRNVRKYLGSTTVADGKISIHEERVYFSPYSWYDGGSFKLNTVGGGYIKIAFTGDVLGITVDATRTKAPGNMIIQTYVDGATEPIMRTLDFADDSGYIKLTDNLSSGQHYAIVYLSSTDGSENAWTPPPKNALYVRSLHIAPGAQLIDLADTPIKVKSRRVLFYGDSITEGYGTVKGNEYGYAPVMANLLDCEYGQCAVGGAGWTHGATRGVDTFYYENGLKGYWRYHYYGASRFVDDDIKKGYIDGTPDAVFINMGTNDIAGSDSDVQSKINSWIRDIRLATSKTTEIFVIVPFKYGNGEEKATSQRAAFLKGYSNYADRNKQDTHIHLLDLGTEGHKIVVDNSTDALHPDLQGSSILGHKLADLAKPLLP